MAPWLSYPWVWHWRKMRTSSVVAGLLGLCLLALLPVLGNWIRRGDRERCELDGIAVEPLYRVRIVDGRGKVRRFCGVQCAATWLSRANAGPWTILVTDEATGQEFDAASASFVRSGVVTNAVTGNRIHVFQDRSAAEAHARVHGGRLLTKAEKPLQAAR